MNLKQIYGGIKDGELNNEVQHSERKKDQVR